MFICEHNLLMRWRNGKNLWQTLNTFDRIHSLQAILLCGKHFTTLKKRIVSGSQAFVNKLDVQETDFWFTQFDRSWSDFCRCRFTHGWDSSSWSLGMSDWSFSFFTKRNQKTKDVRESPRNLPTTPQWNMKKQILTTNTFLCCTSLKTMKPWWRCWSKTEVPRVKNPQSCFGLVVWQN